MKSIALALALAAFAAPASAQCFVGTFNGGDLDGYLIHVDHNLNAVAPTFAIFDENGRYQDVDPNGIIRVAIAVSANRLDFQVDSGELSYYPDVDYTIRVCD